jgi:polyisoprenyl-phosphate glycosyltransferase
MVDYSIIIPVFYNEGSLAQTMDSIYNEVIQKNKTYTCEIIFIDDGSGDGSLQELLKIRNQYPEIVKVIKLTRNFGQGNAILAGFYQANGKCVINISADGQDPPHLINDMLRAYFEENYEIAICAREGRDESFYRVITSRITYFLIKKLAFPNMPRGGFDYFLLGQRSLSVFLRNVDKHPFFQGEILWMGFKTKVINYVRQKRAIGKSRWTFGKKFTYLLDSLMSYSFAPIRLLSLFGAIVAIGGFIYAFVIFLSKLIWDIPITGWAPLMIVILVLGGLQLLMLGMIGEYLWRTLSQVRNRDFYVIDEIYDKDDKGIPEKKPIN